MTEVPTRPVLRWHGGKWRLAPWIIAHFPPHKVYVEPFGGAASVLVRKSRSYAEIYNDLDDEVVNLFRLLRDEKAARDLIGLLRLTPFARTEFDQSYATSEDPCERARQLVAKSFMGFGSDGATADWKTGFRANSNRSGTTPATDWANYPDALQVLVARLRGVIIENRPAIQVMQQHDASTTLHYVDPPYVHDTRSAKSRRGGAKYHAYRHELTDADHVDLLDSLKRLDGMVVLSGYPNDIYEGALVDWHRVERKAMADGARERTEVLWLNPRCCQQLRATKDQGDLLEAAE